MRLLTTTLALLGCLLLGSCFDVREEIWIKRDGSGHATLEYVIPSSALSLAGGETGLRDEITKVIDSIPELDLDALLISEKSREATITAKISTDSMLSLIDLPENEQIGNLPNATKGFAGTFDIRLDGLTVDFQREINLRRALGLASVAISGAERRQRRLRYIIHLPAAAENHDALRTENDGKTLIWDYTLGEALQEPLTTSFRASVPIPRWAIVAAASAIGILVWIIIRILKRRRRPAGNGDLQLPV